MHSLKKLPVNGKVVLVRTDLNVPFDKRGRITDDKRLRAVLPTIQYLIKKKAIVVLISHLGRPKGKVVESLRMDPVATRLSKLLKKEVYKLNDCVGPGVEDFINECVPGEVVLLENLRFHTGEEANNNGFTRSLMEFADFFVNDAFGTMHRAHASVVGLPNYLPSAPGLLVEKEIKMLSPLLKKPKKPYIAVMGGVKVSGKIGVIKELLKKVDVILIGGAMMFTFLNALGNETGKSVVEDDKLKLAKSLLKSSKKKIILPIDTVVDARGKKKNVSVHEMTKGMKGLDIGPETTAIYNAMLQKANTVFWNGPMGMFEEKKYAKGTNEIAKTLAKRKATVIVGGGDSAAAVEKLKLEKKFTHVSTGGGAALAFVEGKKLPGMVALETSARRHKVFKRKKGQ